MKKCFVDFAVLDKKTPYNRLFALVRACSSRNLHHKHLEHASLLRKQKQQQNNSGKYG